MYSDFFFIVFSLLAIIVLYLKVCIYEDKIGCPVPESDLAKEMYLILSMKVHEDKVYYLLKGGSKVVTCWVDQFEGLKDFIVNDDLLVPKEQNN